MKIVVSKSRLAAMAGITGRTLSNYINKGIVYQHLVDETGYRKHQKILTPRQVSIIIEFFVFELDNQEIN